jgi:predicted Zn-dependent protease
MQIIILQRVLYKPDKDIVYLLEKLYQKSLMLLLLQWKSNDILQWLSDKYNKPSSKPTTTKILAICDFDAYSGRLNFVFGQAYADGSISAIYLPRLRQEFYGLKPDEYLFYQRIVKEACFWLESL